LKSILKLLLLAVAFFSTRGIYAQAYETTLTGTVSDTTGATVTNALVTVVNSDTNASRSSKTTGAMAYYVGSLPIGHYNLRVTCQNFSTERIKDIEPLERVS